MNKTIADLKLHIQRENSAGPRRTHFFPLIAQSLKSTTTEPRQIRRAKAFAYLLDNVDQIILPYEPLVGSIGGMWPLDEQPLSYDEIAHSAKSFLTEYREAKSRNEYQTESRFALIARDHYDANISYEHLQSVIAEMQDFFREDEIIDSLDIARELERFYVYDYGQDVRDAFDELPWIAANHLHLDYGKLMKVGFGGIKREIRKRRGRFDDEEHALFYDSAEIAVDAAIRFTTRYAETARRAAEHQAPDRAAELTQISGRIAAVAEAPPQNFQEGIQLLWMAHLIANIGGGSALSFGRFDQYMYPLYAQSIETGICSREYAYELVSALWLKVNEPKMRTVQSIALGGTDSAGRDTSNDLTRLCLQVCADLKTPFPNTSLRVHSETPPDLYDLAVDAIVAGSGNPMIMNDDVWIPNLMKRGVSREEACEYYNMGCVEIMLGAMQAFWHGLPGVSFPALTRETLSETTVDFEDFDSFLSAYLSKIRTRIQQSKPLAGKYYDEAIRRYYDPFGSCLIAGCLESGRDMFQRGAVLPGCFPIGGSGLGTAVDSLAAIREFVFARKTLSLDEMIRYLDADFDAAEDVRTMLENGAGSFGNDEETIDSIAARVLKTYTEAVQSLNDGEYDGQFISSLFSYTSQVSRGELVGATPNGRHAGAPISDNAGPSQGKDTGGPTRLLNSIAKLPLDEVTGAYAMNLKIDAGLLESVSGRDAFKTLIKTHFDAGGIQLQINCIDEAALIEAQKNPGQYQDLIVRVAGFSEYFCKLDRSLQNEIISRMSHQQLG